MARLIINSLGEFLWQYLPKAQCESLKYQGLGVYDWYHRQYVTWPLDERLAQEAFAFAHAHQIPVHLEGDGPLETSAGWASLFFQKRLALSWSTKPIENLPVPINNTLTALQQAGALYAAHTRRCFLADPVAEDRRRAALGAVHLVQGYPCLLIAEEGEQATWRNLVEEILPPNYALIPLEEARPECLSHALVMLPYHRLERAKGFLGLGFHPHALLVDEAEKLKHPQARRTQQVKFLAQKVLYRYLLTDFPVNLSLADLREPLRILGKMADFADLAPFLQTLSPDPLDNQALSTPLTPYQSQLHACYFRLRQTCLVRRANDPGLRIQPQFQAIPFGKIPAEIPMPGNIHPLHQLGLEKMVEAAAWLHAFLLKTQGKVLVIAHHHDVVEYLAHRLVLPAIYGPVGDTKREQVWEKFREDDECQALIVASKAALPAEFPPLEAIIFVELFTTPDDLTELMRRLPEDDTLDLILLHSESALDFLAVDRLQARLFEVGAVLDGERE